MMNLIGSWVSLKVATFARTWASGRIPTFWRTWLPEHFPDGRYLICVYEYLNELTIIPFTAYEVRRSGE